MGTVPLQITPAIVATMTGATVTTAQVAQAQSIIELYAGVDLTDLGVLGARNRAWVGKAIAYQAAWMIGQPDLFERLDVTSMTQDGLSLAVRSASALVVGPLARKALNRVSWVRSRTVRVGVDRSTRLANLQSGLYGGDEGEIYRPNAGVAGQPAFDPIDGWGAP